MYLSLFIITVEIILIQDIIIFNLGYCNNLLLVFLLLSLPQRVVFNAAAIITLLRVKKKELYSFPHRTLLRN